MSLVREVLRIKRADGFDAHAGKTPLQRRQVPLDRVRRHASGRLASHLHFLYVALYCGGWRMIGSPWRGSLRVCWRSSWTLRRGVRGIMFAAASPSSVLKTRIPATGWIVTSERPGL
jgi:hypothetical protein